MVLSAYAEGKKGAQDMLSWKKILQVKKNRNHSAPALLESFSFFLDQQSCFSPFS